MYVCNPNGTCSTILKWVSKMGVIEWNLIPLLLFSIFVFLTNMVDECLSIQKVVICQYFKYVYISALVIASEFVHYILCGLALKLKIGSTEWLWIRQSVKDKKTTIHSIFRMSSRNIIDSRWCHSYKRSCMKEGIVKVYIVFDNGNLLSLSMQNVATCTDNSCMTMIKYIYRFWVFILHS